MSIEGMWCHVSDDVDQGGMVNGGVVIFETGRLFGGDSLIAYVGSYSVEQKAVRAAIESWPYNNAFSHLPDVFGEVGDHTRETIFEGVRVNDDEIHGFLSRPSAPEKLPLFLKKMRDLP